MVTSKSHPIHSMSKEEVLLQLLKKQRGYYTAILELSDDEKSSLQQGKTGSVLTSLIKKKEILFSCIEEIDEALAPLKKYWDEKKQGTDSLSRAVKEEITQLNELIQTIIQLDKDNQKMLTKILLDMKSQVTTTLG